MVSRAIDSRSMIVFSPKSQPQPLLISSRTRFLLPYFSFEGRRPRKFTSEEFRKKTKMKKTPTFSFLVKARTRFLLPYFSFEGRRPRKFMLELSEETRKKTKMKKTCNGLLMVYARAVKDVSSARKLFEEMPDAMTFDAILGDPYHCGRFAKGEKLCDSMKEKVVASGLLAEKCFSGATELMEEKWLKLDAYTYNLFIKTFVNEGHVEEGETPAEGDDGKKPEPILVGENPAESSGEGKYSALSENQGTVDGVVEKSKSVGGNEKMDTAWEEAIKQCIKRLKMGVALTDHMHVRVSIKDPNNKVATKNGSKVGDPVVYQLVRVDGNGRIVPATDDAVIAVADLLEDDKQKVISTDTRQTLGCVIRNGSEPCGSETADFNGSDQLQCKGLEVCAEKQIMPADSEMGFIEIDVKNEDKISELDANAVDANVCQSGSLDECSMQIDGSNKAETSNSPVNTDF